MGDMKHRDSKEKKYGKFVRKNELITSHRDLVGFTRQVENHNITDEHFKKAYDSFKQPPYGQKG